MVTLAHQYLVTEELEELKQRDTLLPLLRDPDSSYYLRQEKHGLLLGPYERNCRAHWLDASDPMPDDFSFQLYPDDLERLEWYIEDACARVPLLGTAGITRVINGPIPYAPDGNPLIGPMPGVPNAFEACVFTFGIVQSGGAGKVLAEWITEGETEWDMWGVDPRRFTGFADQDYANKKGVEIYSHEYAIHFPHYEWPDGRDKRLGALQGRLADLGAEFGARAGWERATWFPRNGDRTELEAHETYDREGPWFEAVKAECEAVRDAAGLCALPGFSRFEISGEGVVDWLRGLVTGVIPRVGRIGLVYFADNQGRILTEMSVMRLAEDRMLLLTAAGAEWHDRDWLVKHLPEGSPISIVNRTEEQDCIVLSGPKARDILSAVTSADLSNASNPWLTHQEAEIAGQNVRLVRVSYVGELGWEIHADADAIGPVFDAVWAAGQPQGLKMFGMYAMDSLRLEKGYRSWKQDLSTDYTMLAGGLERFVKLDKPDFIGKAAIEREKQQGVRERFATLLVDTKACDAPYLSTVWLNGERVGLVTSGGWGHRIGQSIALSVVRTDCAEPGTSLEVEIFGDRCPAIVQADQPLYDPENARLKA